MVIKQIHLLYTSRQMTLNVPLTCHLHLRDFDGRQLTKISWGKPGFDIHVGVMLATMDGDWPTNQDFGKGDERLEVMICPRNGIVVFRILPFPTDELLLE